MTGRNTVGRMHSQLLLWAEHRDELFALRRGTLSIDGSFFTCRRGSGAVDFVGGVGLKMSEKDVAILTRQRLDVSESSQIES